MGRVNGLHIEATKQMGLSRPKDERRPFLNTLLGLLLTILCHIGCVEKKEKSWGDGGSPFNYTCTLDESDTKSDAETSVVNFACIHPIFVEKCGDCHTINNRGHIEIGHPDQRQAYENSQLAALVAPGKTVGEAIILRAWEGSMPHKSYCSGDPETDNNETCLSKEELDLIQRWIDTGQTF